MDFNDIETMLREKRATPEEIAKAFTDQLNAAIAATAEPTEWEKGLVDTEHPNPPYRHYSQILPFQPGRNLLKNQLHSHNQSQTRRFRSKLEV